MYESRSQLIPGTLIAILACFLPAVVYSEPPAPIPVEEMDLNSGIAVSVKRCLELSENEWAVRGDCGTLPPECLGPCTQAFFDYEVMARSAELPDADLMAEIDEVLDEVLGEDLYRNEAP